MLSNLSVITANGRDIFLVFSFICVFYFTLLSSSFHLQSHFLLSESWRRSEYSVIPREYDLYLLEVWLRLAPLGSVSKTCVDSKCCSEAFLIVQPKKCELEFLCTATEQC